MQTKLRLLIFAMLSLSFVATACGDLEEDCDPAVDEGCVCTLDDSGLATDDCIDGETADGEACTCAIEDNNDGPVCGNGTCEAGEDADSCAADCDGDGPVCGNGTCEAGEDADSCAADCEDAPQFRFVLLEDATNNVSGDFPGADIDAIGLIKGDGSGEVFASSVEEDSDVPCEGGNLACDTNALTGAPDVVDGGNCFGGGAPDGSLFTALNQGFVIVGFGDNVIENGDSIHVYEIGATECGRFDNDPFKVSVGVSDAIDTPFVEICDAGNGTNICPVSGL